MVTPSKNIWMDGAFVHWDKAQVHVLTHALHYGLASFEGIRCYEGKMGSAIFRLPEHVNRLFESAHITMMPMPYTKKEIGDAIVETVRVNQLASCYIRPIAYVGYGAMGLYPGDNPVNVAIAAWPWGSYLGEEALAKGIRAKISSFTRHHVNVSMTRAKVSGYYVNSILAKWEAKKIGVRRMYPVRSGRICLRRHRGKCLYRQQGCSENDPADLYPGWHHPRINYRIGQSQEDSDRRGTVYAGLYVRGR